MDSLEDKMMSWFLCSTVCAVIICFRHHAEWLTPSFLFTKKKFKCGAKDWVVNFTLVMLLPINQVA